MTTPTQAAQPVLTDDEILTVTLYGQSEARMIRNGRAIESALLSKLRAPVADERAAFETWNSMHGQYRRSDAYERLDTGDYVKWPVEHGWRVWQARAALANASVADSTLPLEQALYELVDKIDAGLDTGDILQDARRASTALDAIMASAPVALSGVERQAVTGLIAVARAAFTFCDDAEDTGVATVNVDRDDIAKLGEALDLLDELPDDQP
ncbi:hypothetical protein, partial [Listeria monocytogenes]